MIVIYICVIREFKNILIETSFALLVFECLIFIGEEIKFRWRWYKLQKLSTDMHMTCAYY